jgi:hypothetical protein
MQSLIEIFVEIRRQDDMADRIPREHKDKANEQYERGKHFLTEEYFPEERRDQFIYRGKKVGFPTLFYPITTDNTQGHNRVSETRRLSRIVEVAVVFC